MLKLRPVYTNVPMEKKSCKKSLVGSGGPSSLKLIFSLLKKVIAVYMQLTIIHLWYLSFKRLLALCRKLSRSLNCFQVSFHELSEQFIRKGQSESRSGNQSKNQSKNQSGARTRITRRSKRGTIQIETVGEARVFGKLIFYMINRGEVLIRGTTRAGTSGRHLGKWPNIGDKVFFQTGWLTRLVWSF